MPPRVKAVCRGALQPETANKDAFTKAMERSGGHGVPRLLRIAEHSLMLGDSPSRGRWRSRSTDNFGQRNATKSVANVPLRVSSWDLLGKESRSASNPSKQLPSTRAVAGATKSRADPGNSSEAIPPLDRLLGISRQWARSLVGISNLDDKARKAVNDGLISLPWARQPEKLSTTG